MNSKIFKNSSYLLLAQIFTKIIAFFYTLFLARKLGVNNYGLYTFALSYFTLISALSDLGISRYVIKEVVSKNQNITRLISNILILRLFLTIILVASFSLFTLNFDGNQLRGNLAIIAVMAIIPQVIGLTFDNIFIAFQKFSISAVALLITSFTTTCLGVVLILKGFNVMGATLALVLGQLVYSLYLLIFSGMKGVKFEFKFSILFIYEILKGSLPYGLLSILGFLYFKIDVLILAYLRGSYETGIYGAAYKFLEALVFVPSTLAVAIFPILVKLHATDLKEIRKLFLQIIIVMGGLGFMVMVIFILILPVVITLILPGYEDSIGTVKILSLAIPFMFIHVPLSQIMLSSNKYLKQLILLSFFPLILNFLLNLYFIPRYGYIAAAWITVISDVFSLFLLVLCLRVFVFKDNGR